MKPESRNCLHQGAGQATARCTSGWLGFVKRSIIETGVPNRN